MSRRIAALVTIGGLLGGCTNYAPVHQSSSGTWQEARLAANQPGAARATAASPAATPANKPATTTAAAAPAPITTTPLPASSTTGSYEPRPLPPLQTDTVVVQETAVETEWVVDERGYRVPVEDDVDVVDTVAMVETAPAPLVVPVAPAATPPAPAKPAPTAAAAPKPAAPKPAVAASDGGIADAASQGSDLAPPALSNLGFMWPVDGKVVDATNQGAAVHAANGLMIAAPMGTPFVAAENGVVVFSGSDMATYGYMVVVRHDGDYTTAYGHAQRLDVAKGDVVRRGQRLGLVGDTGDVATPELYFEMRVGSQVVDPRHYLMGSPKVASN